MVESQGGANLWLRQLFGVPMSGRSNAMVNKQAQSGSASSGMDEERPSLKCQNHLEEIGK